MFFRSSYLLSDCNLVHLIILGSSIPFVGAIDGWSEVHIKSINGNITVNGKVCYINLLSVTNNILNI